MKVIFWSPSLTAERAAAVGAELVGNRALFETADVVSLHLVLGPTTQCIVTATDIAAMQPHTLFINTSRASLVDQSALLDAVLNRRIGGAGIDVFDQEPLPADAPERHLPRLLATPHLGYCVQETFEVFYRQSVENLDA